MTVKFGQNGELLREALVPGAFSTLVDSLYNEAVRHSNAKAEYRPVADVIEKENTFEINAILPGLKKEDINLELKDNKLVLKGERKQDTENDKAHYHVKESIYGSFQRSFRMPENINKDSIKAEFKDGILYVSIDKQTPSSTSIEIK